MTGEPETLEETAVGGRQPAGEDAEHESSTGDGRLSTEPEDLDEIPDPAVDLAEHLLDVNVRLWAELGRARLPLAEAVALGTGAIVDLDKQPDDQLDVYVNGTLFARAGLLLVDGEWALRLDEIVASPDAVEQASNSGSGA
jgi:flagellar motor switch protein FliN